MQLLFGLPCSPQHCWSLHGQVCKGACFTPSPCSVLLHTCCVLAAAWQLRTSYTAIALCILVGYHWPLLPAGGSVTVTNNNAGTTTVTPDSNGNPTVNGQVGMHAC